MKIIIKRSILLGIALMMVLFTACSTQTTYEGSTHIAEPQEVVQAMEESGDVVVLDARSAEDYAKGHVAGAIHIATSDLVVDEPIKAVMASPDKVAAVLGSKGIGPDTMVYIYDNNGGVNASRVWWTMKSMGHKVVKVINNGAKGMELAAVEMSLEVPVPTNVDYPSDGYTNATTATLEDIQAIQDGASNACIIDVRTLSEFDEGAIPKAMHYPHAQNLYKDGTFKSRQDIYLNYKDLGIDRDDEVILYCKSSFRATQTMILLNEAGFSNVKIYDGAWLEWSQSGQPALSHDEPVILTEQDAS